MFPSSPDDDSSDALSPASSSPDAPPPSADPSSVTSPSSTEEDDDSPPTQQLEKKRRPQKKYAYKHFYLDFRVIPYSSQPEPRLTVVIPRFLYLSGIYAAKDIELLREVKITHVVSCLDITRPLREHTSPDLELTTHIVPVNDTPANNIFRYFEPAVHFIHSVRLESEASQVPLRVLVHCWGGVSRSISIVLAYLMFRTKGLLTFETCLQMVREMRPEVGPNRGFVGQLRRWEELLIQMRREKEISQQQQQQQKTTEEEEEEEGEGEEKEMDDDDVENLDSDSGAAGGVAGAAAGDPPTIIGHCHRCRHKLFQEGDDWQHEPEVETLEYSYRNYRPKTKFAYRKQQKDARPEYQRLRRHNRKNPSATANTSTTCESFFFESPLPWMRNFMEEGEDEGILRCPNVRCGVKLGSFKWRGSQCSCGKWVVPSVQILKSRVDYFRLRGIAKSLVVVGVEKDEEVEMEVREEKEEEEGEGEGQ